MDVSYGRNVTDKRTGCFSRGMPKFEELGCIRLHGFKVSLAKSCCSLEEFDFMNVCRCHGIKIPDLNKMLKSRKFGSSKGLPVCSSTLKVICWWTVAVLQSWWWDSLAGSRLSFFSTCRLSNNFFYKGYPIKLQTTIR